MVLTAISEPDSRPACRASSASSADAAGKLRPIDDGHRQDHQEHRAGQRPGASRAAGSVSRVLRAHDARRRARAGRAPRPAIWATARSRTGSRDARSDEVEQQGAEREADEEDREDDREHVRRVAGPRREQPRPQHLVAERGQAGDEGDGQGQGRPGRRGRSSTLASAGAGSRHGSTGSGAASRAAPSARASRATTPGDRRARARRCTARRVRPSSSISTRPGGERAEDRADRVRRVQAPERLAQVRVRRSGGGSASAASRP